MPAKLTTDKFIEKAIAVHGDKYTYENTNYRHSQTKILVNCPVHKAFEIRPAMFLRGRGCPECGLENVGRPFLNTEDFIAKAKEVHGNIYDYSKVQYETSGKKVVIICKLHGEFLQRPSSHCSTGNGCPKCANDYVTSFTRDSTESFIRKAQSRHGDTFDYSHVQYVNNGTKIKIACRTHGIFLMTPNQHLNGSGCKICNKVKRAAAKK